MSQTKDWTKFVGFYGCGKRGNTRVVRVGTRANPFKEGKWLQRFPKEGYEVDCPACEDRHHVRVLWRNPNDDEEFDKSEFMVGINVGARDYRNPTIARTRGK